MDVRLRSGDGVTATHRLRTSGAAPVVFITASIDAMTGQRAQ